MENISHSIASRRSFTSYSNAFTAPHNSVYDDVFGGPPKVGIPTLAPRFEDYAEIFGGFHAYRSSSIPVLHLPSVADDSDLHFQDQSSDFDYAEVFGGFRGFGSAASYEDLVGKSGGRCDSSDEPWSPAQNESLSDKVDPLLAPDKNYRLPDGDGHQSLESIKQFNINYNKSSERTMESVLNGTCHVTNLRTDPAYTNPSNERSIPPNEKDELCSMHVIDDINCSKDFTERVAEEKQCDKSLLTPSYCGFATHGYDFNPSENHVYSSSTPDKPFITISDISLRTKPSQLPPPSRPPPALAAKNGGCDRSNSIFAPSKSYAFERVLDGTSPYIFDVEVDVTASVQGLENGNKSFQVKQRGFEKLNEKKDIQAHSKLHLENAMKMEEKTNRTFSLSSTLTGEKMQQSHRIETVGSVPFIEESLRARKNTEPISESQGGKYTNHFAKNSMDTVAWRESKEYFEVMETKNSKEASEKVEGGDTLKQSMTLHAYKHQGIVESDEFYQKQDSMRIKAIKEAPMWDEDRNPLELAAEDYDCGNEHGKMKANYRLSNKKDLQEKLILNKPTCIYNSNKMIPETFQQPGEKLQIDRGVMVEKHEEAMCHEVEAKWKLEVASKNMGTEKGFIYAHSRKEKSGNHNENIVTAEYPRRPEEAVVRAETREKVQERIGLEENDTQQREGREKENVTKLNDNHEQKENDMRVKQAVERRDCGKEQYTDVVHAKTMVNEQLHCKLEKDKDAGKQEATELRFGNCPEHARDDKKQRDFHDCELMKDRSGNFLEREVNDVGILKSKIEVGNEGDPFEREIELPLYGDASMQEELRGRSKEIELIQRNGHLKEVNWDLESHVLIEGDRLRVFDEASKCYDENATEVTVKHNDPLKKEETQAIFSVEGNGKLNDEPESRVHEPEARMDDPLFNEKIYRFGKNKVELQDRNSHSVINHMSDSPSLLEHVKYLNKGDSGNGNTCVMLDKIAPEIVFGPETETMKRISAEDERLGKAGAHFIQKEDIRDSLAFRGPVQSGNILEGASPVVSEHNEDALSSSRNASIRKMETKEKNENENLAPKDQLLRENLRNETVLEIERMRKIEEREWEREREREREKDRMAVDKEALETHTRLYAEARERAAVGRTTAEFRQKAMSEARDRLELASNEARLRAERAAVERATVEARQRAIDKSIAEKAAFDTRERVEKPMSDRFYMFSRCADARQSSLSTDLHHQSTGISNGLRNSYASAHFGTEGESPQRCRARLQRYQRTAERAANALAEKNMRDLLAQREREERNRVAETLDTEVRRWSSGKEGNLRALLSTLQYILGPDSGWHPVPLTEVITSAAVKKAYRRATLCVHPDKLQQRGATIQQKYISEKVFDLLKEAWNKFNSEER